MARPVRTSSSGSMSWTLIGRRLSLLDERRWKHGGSRLGRTQCIEFGLSLSVMAKITVKLAEFTCDRDKFHGPLVLLWTFWNSISSNPRTRISPTCKSQAFKRRTASPLYRTFPVQPSLPTPTIILPRAAEAQNPDHVEPLSCLVVQLESRDSVALEDFHQSLVNRKHSGTSRICLT